MSSLARYLDPEVIQQVSRLDLRARFIVEGFLAGLHSSPFHGFSVEFSEHRKYVKGDDTRTIDWSVYARTDRLYVRKYQAETHLACHLIVDASASMGYVGAVGGGEPERRSRLGRSGRKPPSPQPAGKLMYVVHLAAALGYLITRQQDAVGLCVVGDGLEQMLPPRSRRANLVQMVSTLSSIVPRGRTGLARGIHEALARISHRGMVVVLSDLLTDAEELIEALHHIRFRGHDLIVMHVLDAGEAHFPFQGSVRLEDPESGESLVADADAVRQRYLDGLHDWREKLRREIEAARGDYLPLDTSMPFDKALIEFLTQRQRRR